MIIILYDELLIISIKNIGICIYIVHINQSACQIILLSERELITWNSYWQLLVSALKYLLLGQIKNKNKKNR